MNTYKKEIPNEQIDKFFNKEFGAHNKCSDTLPSEIFRSGKGDMAERFAEIAEKVYGKKISIHNANVMICRFEMFL